MRVVSGSLIRDGRVLMGLRKAGGMRPDLWELPGGKVEGDESPAHALSREWEEECGCTVNVDDFLATAALFVEVSFVVELYRVSLVGDQRPVCVDHQRLAWVDPLCAVKWLPCSPAYYMHFAQLRPIVEATRPLPHSRVYAHYDGPRCPQCNPTREEFLQDLAERTIK